MVDNVVKVRGVGAINVLRWFIIAGMLLLIAGAVTGGNTVLLGLGLGLILVFSVPMVVALHISSKSAKQAHEQAKTNLEESLVRERGHVDMLTDVNTREFWSEVHQEVLSLTAAADDDANALYADPMLVRQSVLMALKNLAQDNPAVTLEQFKIDMSEYVRSRRASMSPELAFEWDKLLSRV